MAIFCVFFLSTMAIFVNDAAMNLAKKSNGFLYFENKKNNCLNKVYSKVLQRYQLSPHKIELCKYVIDIWVTMLLPRTKEEYS